MSENAEVVRSAIDQLRELLATNFLTDTVDGFHLFICSEQSGKLAEGTVYILCSLFRDAHFYREIFCTSVDW